MQMEPKCPKFSHLTAPICKNDSASLRACTIIRYIFHALTKLRGAFYFTIFQSWCFSTSWFEIDQGKTSSLL